MISLIMTVRNERALLPEWFASIDHQLQEPDEMIIVDGGSTDGTWELLQEEAQKRHNLRVFQYAGNIASGRNYAIAKCTGEIIAVTDAGCVYDTEWLRDVVAPIVAGTHRVSATAFAPWFTQRDGAIVFAVAAATMPRGEEFAQDWLPSSRSFAFLRATGERAGFYPEWIPFCEDVLFDRALAAAGEPCAFVRTPRVYWRPRTTFFSYLAQVKNYTRSEAHAGLNYARHAARHGVYLGFPAVIFLACNSVALVGRTMYIECNSVACVFVLSIGVGAYAWYALTYFRRAISFSRKKTHLFRAQVYSVIVPVIIWGDIAKICGWWMGLVERHILRKYRKT
jgi:glycosyltransferase involved in cell wall biosynthesis